MEKKLPFHWQLMKETDSEMYDSMLDWRNSLVNKDIIPRKYRELMLVCMCCMIQFEAGIAFHSKCAMDFGATREELINAISQTATIGGIPAYKSGAFAVQDLLVKEETK